MWLQLETKTNPTSWRRRRWRRSKGEFNSSPDLAQVLFIFSVWKREKKKKRQPATAEEAWQASAAVCRGVHVCCILIGGRIYFRNSNVPEVWQHCLFLFLHRLSDRAAEGKSGLFPLVPQTKKRFLQSDSFTLNPGLTASVNLSQLIFPVDAQMMKTTQRLTFTAETPE